jgi:Na+/H+ antiporter NhaD/arsenite permease-like protein
MLSATHTGLGVLCLAIFGVAYAFVIGEEFTQLSKSKPVMLAAGILWIIVAIIGYQLNQVALVNTAINANLLEYSELLLFLIVAMVYINVMTERGVFMALRNFLLSKGFSYRQLFWLTGILTFFISPIADNLSTALIMCAVALALGKDNPRFIALSCINIVVAANAGGAFSPFGDITTLMVWQQNVLPFFAFFKLFIPSAVSFLIPAFVMSFAIPKGIPEKIVDIAPLKRGASISVFLFLMTITTAVAVHTFLHLPPAFGMMLGLSYLQFFAYFMKQKERFDIFKHIEHIEWDTLLFFYGVMLCIGALATLGYLELVSNYLYGSLGTTLPHGLEATPANVLLGALAALLGNIPIMSSVLSMQPVMSEGQWLLITLTAGIGGNLLAIGSAAGIALMRESRGQYTFLSHLKWSWIILIGYLAAIAVHILINYSVF